MNASVDSGCGFVVLSDLECGGSLDGVPIFLRERIGSLLEALLALGETLVLPDSHDCSAVVEWKIGRLWRLKSAWCRFAVCAVMPRGARLYQASAPFCIRKNCSSVFWPEVSQVSISHGEDRRQSRTWIANLLSKIRDHQPL